MSHRHWYFTAGLALCLFSGGLAADSRALAAEPEIVFDPAPSVTVRKTDGTSARGRLISINEDEIRLRILNGREIELELERVRVIRGGAGKASQRSAGKFEFQPTVETFDDLVQRVPSMPYAKLSGEPGRVVGSDANPQFRSRPSQPSGSTGSGKREDGDDTRGFSLGGAPAGSADVEQPRAARRQQNNNPFGFAGDAANDAEDDEEPAGPVAGTEILVCSMCERDLPAGFRSGGKCPNCGETLVLEEDSADSAVDDPAARASNPFAAPGGAAPREDRVVAASSTRRNQAPSAAEATEFSFSNMPPIAKIGIFFGFIVAGWFVLQRR